jgi:hypothetical protein
MLVRVKATLLLLAVAGLADCRGSLSRPDGGTGTGGGGGTGFDAAAVPSNLRFGLDTASALWAAAKPSCPIYSYDRRWSSVFGGGSSTEVEIRHDVPTRRRYSTAQGDGGVSSPLMVVWDETGDMVGRNTTSYTVFPPSTVEQLLAECAMVLAHSPADYILNLVTDPYGVPLECTNFPRGCYDDCESGIRIATFACAPLSASGPM